ncbi:hypothetical protein K503DRAFT_861044 [Rhizopogon vinicolor AM-OR11-026]|uniref:Uncharacterized protein n=1 Tax=Rhizopogon vinicolor AM-OR11-026 TaxID=1314800 RepID=A0A1B7NJ73_9AGAM|nr:hypothetical protein K503DRAFT_861044 [Rhizopogon vinicolor AM-OR11-026]
MISVPGREVLQAMKRADIQKLCKEYGVKANLKTEILIELLLDASQPQPSRSTPVQPPPRSTSIIIASQPGARLRGRSNSSVIIHDIDEEDEVVEETEAKEQPETQNPPTPTYSTLRTRKARDTQYRLGVGRPTIAGGSGARAVTKSGSISRGSKRAKSTRNVKPSEETIVEELEPERFPAAVKSSEQAGPSGNLSTPSTPLPAQTDGVTESLSSIPIQTQTDGMTESLPSIPLQVQTDAMIESLPSIPLQMQTDGMTESLSSHVVEGVVAAALAPVQKELEAQKAQLSELADKVTGIIEKFETRIRGLTAEIEYLRAQASGHGADTLVHRRQKVTPQRIPPSTPKRVRSPVDSPSDPYSGKPESSAPSSDSSNPNGLLGGQELEMDHPNQAGSLLPGFCTIGKRPRDSNASTTSAFFEFGQEQGLSETEITKRIARPAQKRVKIGSSDHAEDMGESSGPSSGAQGNQTNPGPSQPSARPGFSMFGVSSGRPDLVDPPPPTESLGDFFGPPSPPFMSAPSTSIAGEPNPFHFSFLPTSTPAHAVFPTTMGTFPRPEPPTSPSPANNVDRPGSRQGIFGHHRGSSGTTGRSVSGGPISGGQEGGENSSTWIGGLQRQPSSNEVASGLGLTVLRTTAMEEGTPVPPARRTMYGTELEDDTRFGDFGVEGVATGGFWSSGM